VRVQGVRERSLLISCERMTFAARIRVQERRTESQQTVLLSFVGHSVDRPAGFEAKTRWLMGPRGCCGLAPGKLEGIPTFKTITKLNSSF
jgi:hypothetical protein